MSEPEEVQTLIKLLDPRLADDQTDLYRRALEQFDRVILRRSLERCEGNLTKAAALLGLSRVTLRSKLRTLGLATGRGNAPEPAETNPNHPPNHPQMEHAPQGHPNMSQVSGPPLEGGQDLTRQDKPSAGFSEPHLGDMVRREPAGFRKP